MLIGISQDNYGLGIALALALGIGIYVTGKEKVKEEDVVVINPDTNGTHEETGK